MLSEHPSPFGPRWRARWIWAGRPAIRTETATRPVLDDPADRVVLLRRRLDVGDVPATVPCRVWADGRYVLRVNGTEVARGPVRADPRQAHYDVVDLAPHLEPGENVLALQARHFGAATSWWVPVPPSYSLGAGSVVLEALVGDEWLVSDRGWRAAPGEAWTPVPVPGDVACLPLESFDARRHPHGWDRPGFDDTSWARAVEIQPIHTGARSDPHPPSEPFGMLRPPVRVAFPGGAVHPAAEVGTGAVAGAALLPDPVAQVLADEHAPASAAGGPADVTRTAFDLG
ncbi:MAG: alpha-L-rhamnosidase, partial [Acidobacteria bacterium]|nr:alpha-L-rhamnosidase [Acidobacteriota bacterium]